MIKGVYIRSLQHDDLPRLWRMGEEVFTEGSPFIHPWEGNEVSRLLAREDSFCFLALRRKKPVAFIAGAEKHEKEKHELEVYWFAVTAPLRERGIEEMLIGETIKEGKKRNMSNISLIVDTTRAESLSFEKFNFTLERQFAVMHLQ